ncbi:divalent-cation tolerance protein CutA [Sphingomonas sp.]|uniref:divalent-cation tolerance protein CutA n=1 Tax=Sphingomonas sp. TaxID=28214 RepID=UPI001DB18219|nr:divalent-cation tolerance protein CutA [Sphingomonas sp.]MBX9797511.1 divalent-cation tolerance protein CutA [Sphingomonas sp.]
MTGVVTIFCAVPDRVSAAEMARGLVEARLAACVQALPVDSWYRWEGKVEAAAEQLLLIKTMRDRADAAMAWLAAHHGYDVPEIVMLPVDAGLPAYLDWVKASVSPD